MPSAQPRPHSPWKLSRYWTTLACVTALVAGMLTLVAGHPLHGGLMLLGSLLLVKGTIWGRRGRRRAAITVQAEGVRDESPSTHHRQREAA